MKRNVNKSNSSLQSIESINTTSDPIVGHNNSGYSSSSSSLVTTTSSISVLQPIHVSDARNRNYLVGSIGTNDSLLGKEELLRYFPNTKLRLFIVTWNMSSKNGPNDIKDLLLPEAISFVPDIYAIGVQEGPPGDFSQFQIHIQSTIGASHVLLHSCTLGVLNLTLFIRRDLIWFCTTPEDAVFNIRPTGANMIKTKGAEAISFALFGTSFLFINSHLTAHKEKWRERIEEYKKICRSLNLPKNLRPLNVRYESPDVSARFDCVFWFGDLNFRLDIDGQEVMKIINKPQNVSKILLNNFKDSDQLSDVMKKGLAFNGFCEPSSPKFPPTYKFMFETNDYDLNSHRVPSFTDRILFRSKRELHVSPQLYDWVPTMQTSDHKPVFALFDVQLRAGRDDINCLNVGYFNRSVYIEALKKRVNEMNTTYSAGSSVCSIM